MEARMTHPVKEEMGHSLMCGDRPEPPRKARPNLNCCKIAIPLIDGSGERIGALLKLRMGGACDFFHQIQPVSALRDLQPTRHDNIP